MTLLTKVVFIYLILLISPEEQKIQTLTTSCCKNSNYNLESLLCAIWYIFAYVKSYKISTLL